MVVAEQPSHKLYGNQQVVIPPQNTSAASNVVDNVPAAPSFGDKLKTWAMQMGQGALSAGTDAALQAGTNALNKGYEAALPGLVKGAGRLGSKLGSKFSSFLGKIVGDAPPAVLGLTMSPQMTSIDTSKMRPEAREGVELFMNQFTDKGNKIVGDAPPEGEAAMTAEQVEAAVANVGNSAAYLLMAELMVEEQMLDTAKGLARNLSPVEMNRETIMNKVPVNATFEQELQTIVTGIRGTPYTANWSVWYVDLVADPPTQGLGTADSIPLALTYTAIAPPKTAPPLGGNNTFEQLKPLLLSAPMSEYSSALRLRTAQTNVDDMMRLVATASNNITAASGYSFALPLIKILGYMLDMYMFFGEGSSNFLTGIQVSATRGWTGAKALRTTETLFPYHERQTTTMSIVLMTEADFTNIITGISSMSAFPEWAPDRWGDTVAVVFIPAAETSNASVNTIRVMSQLGYPARRTYDVDFAQYWITQAGVPQAGTGRQETCSLANQVVIPGPQDKVIIVVTNTRTNDTSLVQLMLDGGLTLTIAKTATFAQPRVLEYQEANDLVSFITDMSVSSSISAWLLWWETTFGNNSDRASALRFWADQSRLYYPQTTAGQSYSPHSPQGMGGYLTVIVNGEGDWEYAANAPDFTAPEKTLHTLELTVAGQNQLTSMATRATGMHATIMHTPTNALVNLSSRPWNVSVILPNTDPIIDLLVIRKWVYPTEEQPMVSMSDLARTSYTIAVMSNLLAGLTDLMAQANSIPHCMFYVPYDAATQPGRRKILESNFYAGLEDMMSTGIQFPTIHYNRNNNFLPILSNSTAYTLFWGATSLDGQINISVARIPRHDLAQFSPTFGMIYNSVRLSYPQLKPAKSLVTIGADRVPMFRILINEDEVDLTMGDKQTLFNQLARLSQGYVVTNGISPNPGVLFMSATSSVVSTMGVNVLRSDSSRSIIFQGQCGHTSISVPTFSRINQPIGEVPPTRSFTAGFEPFRLLMSGPVDLFGMPEGTYSYEMLYTMAKGSMAITTTEFATVPDSIFTNTGVNRMMTTF
jgi:hypothetical protein